MPVVYEGRKEGRKHVCSILTHSLSLQSTGLTGYGGGDSAGATPYSLHDTPSLNSFEDESPPKTHTINQT